MCNCGFKQSSRKCKPCYNEYYRNYRKNNKEIFKKIERRYNLKRWYGLSEDEYLTMVITQDGVCAICKLKKDKLVVDHNHTTGKVRALLCAGCNTIVGSIESNIHEKAIEYVRHYGLR